MLVLILLQLEVAKEHAELRKISRAFAQAMREATLQRMLRNLMPLFRHRYPNVEEVAVRLA